MRCLYDVLQVGQEADEAAIRSAYRKGALQWYVAGESFAEPCLRPPGSLKSVESAAGTLTKTSIGSRKLIQGSRKFRTHMRF